MIRAVIADDSVLFREGMAHVLHELGFAVVAQAADADELLQRVDEVAPDVAIIDIRMPPTRTEEGLHAAAALGRTHPGLGVLVLSHYLNSAYALQLLRHGDPGRGYLLKDTVSDLESFGAAVRAVAAGGSVVDPQVVAHLVGDGRRPHSALHTLTDRELEILKLMAEGLSNAGICERLVVSPRTIESHIRVLMRKLGLDQEGDNHRRVLAVLAYLRAGVEPEPGGLP